MLTEMHLFDRAVKNPDRLLAVTDTGERVYYRELGEAEALFSKKARRELIFLLYRNTPGCLLSYLGALASPVVPLLLTERTLLERAFWDFAARENATSFAGVPYTYELLDRLKLAALAPPSLRTLTQAGGKLSPALHKKFALWCRETGRDFVVMYGQTEASPRMGWLPPEVSLEKCGSMGIAIPGGTLRLVDDGGKEITSADVTGELVYEGKNVCLGYAEGGASQEFAEHLSAAAGVPLKRIDLIPVAQIPKSPSGKTLYEELERQKPTP